MNIQAQRDSYKKTDHQMHFDYEDVASMIFEYRGLVELAAYAASQPVDSDVHSALHSLLDHVYDQLKSLGDSMDVTIEAGKVGS